MVFLGRTKSLAVLALASSTLAAPSPAIKREPEYHTLIGLPPADFVSTNWVGPTVQYVDLAKEDLASTNATEAPSFEGSAAKKARRGVIGTDDRQLWPNREYPYSAMGKIQWSNGVYW